MKQPLPIKDTRFTIAIKGDGRRRTYYIEAYDSEDKRIKSQQVSTNTYHRIKSAIDYLQMSMHHTDFYVAQRCLLAGFCEPKTVSYYGA